MKVRCSTDQFKGRILVHVGKVSRATIFMVSARRVKGTLGSPWQKTEKV